MLSQALLTENTLVDVPIKPTYHLVELADRQAADFNTIFIENLLYQRNFPPICTASINDFTFASASSSLIGD